MTPGNGEAWKRFRPPTDEAYQFDVAYSHLRSENQQALRQIATDVNQAAGLKRFTLHDAVADTPEESEPGVLHHIEDPIEESKAQYVAAWHGLLGRQKGVTVFHSHGDGPDAVYQVFVPDRPADALRDDLNRLGLTHRVISPAGTGHLVVVFDPGGRRSRYVQQFAEKYDAGIREARGTGASYGGPTRSAARAKYRDIIRAYESRRENPGPAAVTTRATSPRGAGDSPVHADSTGSRPTRPHVNINISANSSAIPENAALNTRAAQGDTEAGTQLSLKARDTLHRFIGHYPSVQIHYEPTTGLYGGDFESSLGVRASFDESDRQRVLAGLAQAGEELHQEQVHVRTEPEPNTGVGHQYPDGSYNTPVHRFDLRRPLSRAELEQLIRASGLYGVTAGNRSIEAYYVGNPADHDAIAEWERSIGKLHASLGGDVASTSREVHRLSVYGRGDGAIPYETIRGPVPTSETPGPAGSSVPSQLIARLARRRVQPLSDAEHLAKFHCDRLNCHPRLTADHLLDAAGDMLRTHWQLHGSGSGWSAVEVPEKQKLAAQRAPKGGITIKGKTYRGGMFIPKEVVQGLSSADQKKLTQAAADPEALVADHKTLRSERQATLSSVSERLGSAATHEPTASEMTAARRSYAQLARHHKDQVLARIDEIVERDQAAFDRAPRNKKPALEAQLRKDAALLQVHKDQARGKGSKAPASSASARLVKILGREESGRTPYIDLVAHNLKNHLAALKDTSYETIFRSLKAEALGQVPDVKIDPRAVDRVLKEIAPDAGSLSRKEFDLLLPHMQYQNREHPRRQVLPKNAAEILKKGEAKKAGSDSLIPDDLKLAPPDKGSKGKKKLARVPQGPQLRRFANARGPKSPPRKVIETPEQREAREGREAYARGEIGIYDFLKSQPAGFQTTVDGTQYLNAFNRGPQVQKVYPVEGYKGSGIGQKSLYSPTALAAYTEQLKADPNYQTEALTVEGPPEAYFMIDGHHRMGGYKAAGRPTVPVWVGLEPDAPAVRRMAAVKAPEGGAVVRGVAYPGGEYLPAEAGSTQGPPAQGPKPTSRLQSILGQAAKAPAAAVRKAKEIVTAFHAKLEARYGRTTANVTLAAAVLTFPIPGNIAAVVGLAEVYRSLTGGKGGPKRMARESLLASGSQPPGSDILSGLATEVAAAEKNPFAAKDLKDLHGVYADALEEAGKTPEAEEQRALAARGRVYHVKHWGPKSSPFVLYSYVYAHSPHHAKRKLLAGQELETSGPMKDSTNPEMHEAAEQNFFETRGPGNLTRRLILRPSGIVADSDNHRIPEPDASAPAGLKRMARRSVTQDAEDLAARVEHVSRNPLAPKAAAPTAPSNAAVQSGNLQKLAKRVALIESDPYRYAGMSSAHHTYYAEALEQAGRVEEAEEQRKLAEHGQVYRFFGPAGPEIGADQYHLSYVYGYSPHHALTRLNQGKALNRTSANIAIKGTLDFEDGAGDDRTFNVDRWGRIKTPDAKPSRRKAT